MHLQRMQEWAHAGSDIFGRVEVSLLDLGGREEAGTGGRRADFGGRLEIHDCRSYRTGLSSTCCGTACSRGIVGEISGKWRKVGYGGCGGDDVGGGGVIVGWSMTTMLVVELLMSLSSEGSQQHERVERASGARVAVVIVVGDA
jgi:hypothetical protein